MDNEIWKDVKGYEGLYKVSSLGRFKNARTGKEIIPYGKKYLLVSLYKNTKRNYLYAHRIVATAFLENKNNLPQVNHINGNKKDNRVENLEWCTSKYNINEAFRLGLAKNGSGIESVRSKAIKQFDLNGSFIKKWESINIAKNELKISHIHECCKGKRTTAGGYVWKYELEG